MSSTQNNTKHFNVIQTNTKQCKAIQIQSNAAQGKTIKCITKKMRTDANIDQSSRKQTMRIIAKQSKAKRSKVNQLTAMQCKPKQGIEDKHLSIQPKQIIFSVSPGSFPGILVCHPCPTIVRFQTIFDAMAQYILRCRAFPAIIRPQAICTGLVPRSLKCIGIANATS